MGSPGSVFRLRRWEVGAGPSSEPGRGAALSDLASRITHILAYIVLSGGRPLAKACPDLGGGEDLSSQQQGRQEFADTFYNRSAY